MADEAIPFKPKITPPDDAADLDSLWLDPKLGDGLVDVSHHNIPVGKPKGFFRVNPDTAYRRLTEIYTHKIEGQIEEQHYSGAEVVPVSEAEVEQACEMLGYLLNSVQLVIDSDVVVGEIKTDLREFQKKVSDRPINDHWRIRWAGNQWKVDPSDWLIDRTKGFNRRI